MVEQIPLLPTSSGAKYFRCSEAHSYCVPFLSCKSQEISWACNTSLHHPVEVSTGRQVNAVWRGRRHTPHSKSLKTSRIWTATSGSKS